MIGLLLSLGSALAQPVPAHVVTEWDMEDGLPQSTVTALDFDEDGYLWVGTFGGMTRFDGERFSSRDLGEPVGIGRITAMVDDGRGGRWIGTEAGALLHHGPDGVRQIESPFDQTIWDLERSGERLLVAASTGIYTYAHGEWRRELEGSFAAVVPTAGGALAVGWSRLQWIHESEPLIGPDRIDGALGAWIDPEGDVWACGVKGAVLVRDDGEVLAEIPELTCTLGTSALVDTQGTLWWGAHKAVLRLGDWRTVKQAVLEGGVEPEYAWQAPSALRTLALDPGGQIWAGLVGSGLVRLAQAPWASMPVGPQRDWAGAGPVLASDGALYFATGGFSLHRMDLRTGDLWTFGTGAELVDSPPALYRSLAEHQGDVYIGHSADLERVVGDQLVVEHRFEARDGITALESDDEDLLVGLEDGRLYRWRDRLMTGPMGQVSGTVNRLLRTRAGQLYVAHDGGAGLLSNGEVAAFEPDQGFCWGAVRDLREDVETGWVFAACYGGGLAWRTPEGRLGRATRQRGALQDAFLSAIELRDGWMWLQGNRGLTKVRLEDFYAWVDDGRTGRLVSMLLPLGEGNGRYRPSSTRIGSDLYLAQVDGVVEVTMDRSFPDKEAAEVRLDGVWRAGEEVGDWRSGVVFAPQDARTLRLEISAPSLMVWESLRFQYRLVGEGLDTSWSVPTATQQVTLAELPLAANALEVRAVLPDGTEGRSLSVPLVLQPRMSERKGLWVVLGLCLVGLAGLVQRVRTRTLVDQTRALQEQVEARVAAQAKLAEREAHFWHLFESSASGMLLYDSQGRCQDANPQACQLFDATAEELRQHSASALGLTSPSGSEVLSLVSLSGTGFEAQVDVLALDGGEMLVQVTDLTRLRKVEAERRRLRAQLDIARRTESLARLAGGVAHDVNNVITAVIGNVELLRYHLVDPDDEALEYLTEVRQSAQRGGDLVRELLTLGRATEGAPVASVAVDDTIRRMVRMLTRLLPEDVHLELDLQAGAHVLISRTKLEQVVANLVINAGDALSSGGTILVRTLADGETVTLVVRDDGVGMSAEVLSNVFEPFYTTKAVGRGTGMGLASVLAIVRQAGGHVGVDSVPGEGSEFSVNLPRTHAPPPSEHPQEEQARLGAEDLSALIWVCDDHVAVCRTTTRLLQRAGFRVRSFVDPRRLIDALTGLEHPPDLLVTDVVMPYLNGKQLASAMRARFVQCQVLFVSAYTADVLLERGVDGSKEDILLHKPFSPEQLLRHVRDQLERGRAG